MRKALGLVITILAAAAADAAIFERYLSAEKPADRAILAYLELEKQGTATSRDLAELGVLLLDKGFPTDAERYLEKALKKDPDNFEARYRLGLVLQRQGRDREATRLYKRVLKQRPGHGYARFMLAYAEERCGRPHSAIKDYAKAYRFAPELSDPDENPLVFLSHLQPQAQLALYKKEVTATTLHVAAIDPVAVRRMMQAVPPPAAAEATPPAEAPTTAVPPAATPAPAPAKAEAAPAAPAAGRGRIRSKGSERTAPAPEPVTAPGLAPAGAQEPQPIGGTSVPDPALINKQLAKPVVPAPPPPPVPTPPVVPPAADGGD